MDKQGALMNCVPI